MDYLSFGKALLDTEDLDPVYCMLTRSGLDSNLLSRWCLAYWCYYHTGVASRCAESKDFYGTLKQGFTEKWPRGRERRHFRTQKSWQAILWLEKEGKPEDIVDKWLEGKTFHEVSQHIKAPQFGPWIKFKIVDMAERVFQAPIDLSDCELQIYKEVVKGFALIDGKSEDEKVDMKVVTSRLLKEFKGYNAPPSYDREIGVTELETIACKYKSHAHGHYEVGLDRKEVRHFLEGWGDLAQHLSKKVP